MLIDCCPLIHSSMSGLLSTLSGQLNLRDHVRAYVGIPLIKKIVTLNLARGDRVIFTSALLSMIWVVVFLSIALGQGLSTAVHLIHVGVKSSGSEPTLAYAGAVLLFAVCPLPLLILVSQFIESAFAILWPPETGTRRTHGVADISMFRSIPLFSTLSDDDLGAIAAQSKEVTYDAGHAIVQQGDRTNTFYSVTRGAVVVERAESSQNIKVVARLGIGDCFGETATLKDDVRSATVRALTQTTVIELDGATFEKVAAQVGGVDFVAVLRAANTLSKSSLFKGLPPERVSSLATKFVPRPVPKGHNVVTFGEEGQEFYLLAKGEVEVLSENGTRVAMLKEGEVFGEVALLRNVRRTATVRTTADSLLLVLSRDVFLQALQQDLSLSQRVEEMVSARNAPAPQVLSSASGH
jgi:CRP-like cAMP-binding protein